MADRPYEGETFLIQCEDRTTGKRYVVVKKHIHRVTPSGSISRNYVEDFTLKGASPGRNGVDSKEDGSFEIVQTGQIIWEVAP